MDEVLAQGVWNTRARRLCGQDPLEVWPSIRIAVTAALSRKEGERVVAVIKGAVAKVLAKSTLASSRAVPIIRYVCVRSSYFSPYRIPASVDHTYYNKYLTRQHCHTKISSTDNIFMEPDN